MKTKIDNIDRRSLLVLGERGKEEEEGRSLIKAKLDKLRPTVAGHRGRGGGGGGGGRVYSESYTREAPGGRGGRGVYYQR